MKKILLFVATSLTIIIMGCSSGNLRYAKEHAVERWHSLGFEVIGYQGYEWYMLGFGTRYGGAMVYYSLKRKSSNIIYTGALYRWGNELQIYNLSALNAIQPRN